MHIVAIRMGLSFVLNFILLNHIRVDNNGIYVNQIMKFRNVVDVPYPSKGAGHRRYVYVSIE